MKRIITIALLGALILSVFSIELYSQSKTDTLKIFSKVVGTFSTSADSSSMVISILEDINRDKDDDYDGQKKKLFRKYTPHWAGIEFGINDFVTSDFSSTLPDVISYMDLNTGKSCNFNINFAQLGLGISQRIGIVTGLAFQFSSYHFDGNNNIEKDDKGVISKYVPADGIKLKKSKLYTTYFSAPLLLEVQIPVKYRRTLNIAAGVIGGVKIGSKTKMVYDADGKKKLKERDDFSLNTLRYSSTVRIGYENFQLYASYQMNSLFKTKKGPELYPYQVGVAFTID